MAVRGSVSAVVAVRNGEATIAKALESLIKQSRPLEGIMVVDDASTDETAQVVKALGSQSPVPVQYLRLDQNQWVFRARNLGAQRVQSEFLFFLDADDLVHETYVERLAAALEANPQAAFAYCNPVYFDGQNSKVYPVPEFEPQELLKRNFVSQCSLIRRQAFAAVGGFSEYLSDCRNHLNEWHLWLSLTMKAGPGVHVDEPLFFYRVDPAQMSKNYERTRIDMHTQMLSDLGLNFTMPPPEGAKPRWLLVCQGRDYIDRSKLGFEVYTWLKPLAAMGDCFTFFYDVEEGYFGNAEMQKRLKAKIEQIQPSHIFHPAYKTHIPVETWAEISRKVKTVAWFSDDNWRFDDYSRHYIQGFTLGVTTYRESLQRYQEAGIDNIVLSQWAANLDYFHDYGLERDLGVSFCGQNYGDREALLKDLGAVCYGRGWPGGMLDFPEMAKVLARSKIALNFAKGSDGRPQLKLRPFEVTACGALLVTEYVPQLEEYFAVGREVVTFRDEAELKEKVAYYLAHEDERAAIARAGMARTQREHTWQARLGEVLAALGDPAAATTPAPAAQPTPVASDQPTPAASAPAPSPGPAETPYDDEFYQNHLKYKDLYQFVADLILEALAPGSVADLGCGCAFLLERLQERGVSELLGLEGSPSAQACWAPTIRDRLRLANLLEAGDLGSFDTVVCMEVAEHIPEASADRLVDLAARTARRHIWWTAAVPGQGGDDHVNCQPLSYWEAKFAQRGWRVDWELTFKLKFRLLANQKLALGYYWFRDNLMVLRPGAAEPAVASAPAQPAVPSPAPAPAATSAPAPAAPVPAGQAVPWVELSPAELGRLAQERGQGAVRLHLGCGDTNLDGFINVDYPQEKHSVYQVAADLSADLTRMGLPPASVDEIRSHHVFEHFNRVQALGMLMRWATWLREGGVLILETPDFEGSAKQFMANEEIKWRMAHIRHLAGDQAADWGFHVDQWWPGRFSATLPAFGLEIEGFHVSTWDREPHLANVAVKAVKRKSLSQEAMLAGALELLRHSMVSEREEPTFAVWREQLSKFLAGESTPTSPAAMAAAVGAPAPPAPTSVADLAAIQAAYHQGAAYQAWVDGGHQPPPPHDLKKALVKAFADRLGLGVMVETGTYMGEMVAAVIEDFDRIYSMEIEPNLHQRAQQMFAGRPHVSILQGDSAQLMPGVVAEIDRPALFWLDGHYSGGVTGKGDLETPILAELDSILGGLRHPAAVLIDDARLFVGANDYPTVSQLVEFVRARRPEARVSLDADAIQILVGF